MDRLLSLNEIGLEFDTDKASSTHDYLSQYERVFERLRHEQLTILEIGVLGGSSLKTWEKYFPNASIIGADIDHRAKRFEGGRIKIEILDQSNLQDLVDMAMRHGPFDVIIEDGSHLWEHQITCLRTLFPFVRNGGIYIVEDLQTNYGTLADNYRGVSSLSCMDYLKRLVDYQVGDEQTNINAEEDAFLRTYARSASIITFIRHACIIEKRHQRKIYGFENYPLVAQVEDESTSQLRLVTHMGNFGDIESNERLFVHSAVHKTSFVQGLTLFGNGLRSTDLNYRVRLSDGRWTDWLDLGQFAGTRGVSQSLTGLTVRLNGELQTSLDLTVYGVFGTAREVVVVKSGEDCVAADGVSPLRGLQIVQRALTAGDAVPALIADRGYKNY